MIDSKMVQLNENGVVIPVVTALLALFEARLKEAVAIEVAA